MSAALWSSGFRPFFLLGAAYGPLAVALWYGARLAGWETAGGAVRSRSGMHTRCCMASLRRSYAACC